MSVSTRAAKPVHILLVDADPAIAQAALELLQEGGPRFHAAHADSLAGACAALAAGLPDCILLALGLPDADGVEAIEQLGRLAPTVPVIVLSGRGEDDGALAAVRAGADDHLAKDGIDGDAIRRAVRRAISRKRAEAELARLALRDGLTCLPNRALYFDRLQMAVRRLALAEGGVAVLLADIRGLNAINATAGHVAGDEVLAEVGRRLAEAVEPGDTVARFGGDEFAVVCCDVSDARDVRTIAKRLSEVVAVPPIRPGELPAVTVQVGTAWTNSPEAAPEELLRRAEANMRPAPDAAEPALRSLAWGSEQEERAGYRRERRQAEQQLRDSEGRFRSAFEAAPAAMALVLAEKGRLARLHRVNPALAEIFGTTPERLLAMDLGSLLEPQTVAVLDGAFAELLRGDRNAAEVPVRHARPDGAQRCLLVSLSLLRHEALAQPTVLLYVRDVTERHRAEEAMRRSEAIKSAIIEAAPDAIVTMDRAGRVLALNAAAEATFGHPRRQAVGRDFAELMLAERERAGHAARLDRALAGGDGPVASGWIRTVGLRADGSELPMEAALAATGTRPPTCTAFVRALTPGGTRDVA